MAKKKPKKKSEHKHTDLKNIYEIKENRAGRKRQTCPKCGDGVFLAEHKNRSHCGKCGYTKWKQ